MKLSQIRDILNAEVLTGDDFLDMDVAVAGGADLMSDVLAFAQPNCLLLTGLTTAQVVYTAEMAFIRAICFVRGKRPDEQTIRLAAGKEMVLMTTQYYMYDSCGRLYAAGIRGHSDGEGETGNDNSGCL